jgi:hypothetical protein
MFLLATPLIFRCFVDYSLHKTAKNKGGGIKNMLNNFNVSLFSYKDIGVIF